MNAVTLIDGGLVLEPLGLDKLCRTPASWRSRWCTCAGRPSTREQTMIEGRPRTRTPRPGQLVGHVQT